MKLRVTRTYQLVTEHEIDLTNKAQDFQIGHVIGMCSEYQSHAAVDALRGIKHEKFTVDTFKTAGLGDKTVYEILDYQNIEKPKE